MHQSLEFRLEVLYYPFFFLFNYNMAPLGVIFPLFLALINEEVKYSILKYTQKNTDEEYKIGRNKDKAPRTKWKLSILTETTMV